MNGSSGVLIDFGLHRHGLSGRRAAFAPQTEEMAALQLPLCPVAVRRLALGLLVHQR